MQRALTRTTLKLGSLAERVARRQAILIGLAGAIAFALGFYGWMLKSPPDDWSGWASNFFRTVQLITLHFPTEFDVALPWQLQVGRLAVPLIAFLGSLKVVVGTITRPIRRALLPLVRDHIVFFGDPKLADAAMASLIGRDHHLVFVHSAIGEARLEVLEGLGGTVVTADPLQMPILDDLNLDRARAVFVSTGDDVDNADLAMMVVERCADRDPAADRLILAVEFTRDDLAGELVAVVDDAAKRRGVRFCRLSPDREGLTVELMRHAPAFSPLRRSDRAHVLVVGLYGGWEQALSRLVVALQDRPEETPIVSLVLDPQEREAVRAWCAARPDLPLVVAFETLAKGSGPLAGSEELDAWRRRTPTPQLVVVMRPDAEGLATVLALRRSDVPIPPTVPILVRRSREDHLLGPLSDARAEAAVAPMVPFGGRLHRESVERLLDRAGEAAAIALHAHYLGEAGVLGVTSPAVLESWEALAEAYRDANRSAVAHVPTLLAAIGRDVGSFDTAAFAAVTPDEWDRLARIEHRRWCADRIDGGWRHAPVRDDRRRLHPCLVTWQALSEADRDKDRHAVRVVLSLAASAATAA
jgi:hypothetical protein